VARATAGYRHAQEADPMIDSSHGHRVLVHNVVAGTGLNFESVGGLVIGCDNTIVLSREHTVISHLLDPCRRHERVLLVRNVRRWRGIALKAMVFILLLSSAGCVTAPIPQTITDTKQLAGLWRGSVPCRDCPRYLPASLLIRHDATWTATVDRSSVATQLEEQASNLHGALGIVDGVLRWSQGDRWYGRVTVVERRGYEYLSMLSPNGQVWIEFQRAK
jgi:hypothetical protein